MHLRAAVSIRTSVSRWISCFDFKKTQRETASFKCKTEQLGRRRVYSTAMWSVMVILGPSWVSLFSAAWSALQGSHNISSYTQAAWTGCQSVWREMLPGQTVFSLWQIPVHWQLAITTSLSLVVTLFWILGEKVCVFPKLSITKESARWIKTVHLSEAEVSWLLQHCVEFY